MGSGINFINVPAWGTLIQDLVLAADSATMQATVPTGFKFLHIFTYLKSDKGAGSCSWIIQVSNGAGTYQELYSTMTTPNVLAVINNAAAASWTGPLIGDRFTFYLHEFVISQSPGAVIKQCLARGMWHGGYKYDGVLEVILPAGETQINTVKLSTTVAGEKFGAGSELQVYGLN
jgi:hypothetical protein